MNDKPVPCKRFIMHVYPASHVCAHDREYRRDLLGNPTTILSMKWKSFHHPDISLPIIRRRAGEELIALLAGTSELLLSGGRNTLYKGCYPNTHAYVSGVSRLRKMGLIATQKTAGSLPALKLTPAAKKKLPPYLHPHKFWNKRWGKLWYILMFDVPEKDRSYRDTLRSFLKQRRFGCLQRSVWVTPWDVRAEYDDLNRTACVDSVAFLFEARTVLGFGNQSVVREAWGFNHVNKVQHLYIEFANENLIRMDQESCSGNELVQLLRMDNLAYAQAMSIDPLLPEELHPENYKGPRVALLHDELSRRISEKL